MQESSLNDKWVFIIRLHDLGFFHRRAIHPCMAEADGHFGHTQGYGPTAYGFV